MSLQLHEELSRSRDVTRELRLRVTKLEVELEAARSSLAAAAGAGGAGAGRGGSKGGYRRPAAADRCAVLCCAVGQGELWDDSDRERGSTQLSYRLTG